MNTQNTLVKQDRRRKRALAFNKRFRKIAPTIFACVVAAFALAMTCFASDLELQGADAFYDKAFRVIAIVIGIIGGGLALWGIVNLLEGYGNDNPGAKSQGMKQLMAGAGIILIAVILVPALKTFFTDNKNKT